MIDQQVKENYKNIDWSKLLRKDMGDYSLEGAKSSLDRIKKIFDDILDYPDVENLHGNLTSEINNQLNIFIGFSDEIINNFLSASDKQHWINRIKETEFNIFNSLNRITNYIAKFDNSKLEEIEQNYRNRTKKLNENLTKAEKIVKETQKLETQKQVAEYGYFFGNEAKKNKKSAKINFWTMIGCVVLTFVFAIIFLQIDFVKEEDGFWNNLFNTINTQNILIKFAILSLGGYLISHFAKNYSAEKHLYNLNIQRQNALNSHKKILDSVIATESENEKEVRNAILLELTKAIFENKNTGYVKNNEKSSFNISPNIKV